MQLTARYLVPLVPTVHNAYLALIVYQCSPSQRVAAQQEYTRQFKHPTPIIDSFENQAKLNPLPL